MAKASANQRQAATAAIRQLNDTDAAVLLETVIGAIDDAALLQRIIQEAAALQWLGEPLARC